MKYLLATMVENKSQFEKVFFTKDKPICSMLAYFTKSFLLDILG